MVAFPSLGACYISIINAQWHNDTDCSLGCLDVGCVCNAKMTSYKKHIVLGNVEIWSINYIKYKIYKIVCMPLLRLWEVHSCGWWHCQACPAPATSACTCNGQLCTGSPDKGGFSVLCSGCDQAAHEQTQSTYAWLGKSHVGDGLDWCTPVPGSRVVHLQPVCGRRGAKKVGETSTPWPVGKSGNCHCGLSAKPLAGQFWPTPIPICGCEAPPLWQDCSRIGGASMVSPQEGKQIHDSRGWLPFGQWKLCEGAHCATGKDIQWWLLGA